MRHALLLLALSFAIRTDALAAAFEPAPPPPGKALIYIYRIKVPPNFRKVKILIDGAPAAKLSNKSYSWIYTDPGSHSIRSEWGMMAGAPSLELVVHVRPDKTYFLKLVGSIRNAGEGRWSTSSGINRMPKMSARPRVFSRRPRRPPPATPSSTSTGREALPR